MSKKEHSFERALVLAILIVVALFASRLFGFAMILVFVFLVPVLAVMACWSRWRNKSRTTPKDAAAGIRARLARKREEGADAPPSGKITLGRTTRMLRTKVRTYVGRWR